MNNAAWTLINDQDDLALILDPYLTKSSRKAIDFETTDLRTFQASIVGVALAGSKEFGLYINTQSPSNDLLTLMADSFVAHNAVYEAGILLNHGVTKFDLDDTMILARLAGKESIGLKALALAELNVQQQPIEELIGKPGKDQLTMDQVDPTVVAPYAADDAVSTLRLWDILWEQLDERDRFVYTHIDKPLIPVVAEMQNEGIRLDKAAIALARKECSRILVEQKEIMMKLIEPKLIQGEEAAPLKKEPHRTKPVYFYEGRRVGPSKSASFKAAQVWEFNPNSRTKVTAVLKTKNAVARTLEALATPLALAIRNYKHAAKLESSYITPLERMGNRAYGSFNIAGTDTGRFSASGWKVSGKPWGINLQTLPKAKAWEDKDSAESDLLRACFIADEGYSMVEIDYSQVELRVLADIADDKNLQAAYLAGRDVHEEMMRHSGLTDRRLAKILNFGGAYEPDDKSASFVVKRTASSQGVFLSQSECEKLVKQYRQAWPEVARYYRTIKDQVWDRRYVETKFGRKLRLRFIPGHSLEIDKLNNATLRQAVNMPIQGTAADIIKMAWASMHRSKPEHVTWKNMVHDSLVLQCLTGKEQEVYAWAKPIMENIVKLSVPLIVEGTYGPNWKTQLPLEL